MRVESPEPDGLGQEMEIDQCNESHAKAQRRKGRRMRETRTAELVYFFAPWRLGVSLFLAVLSRSERRLWRKPLFQNSHKAYSYSRPTRILRALFRPTHLASRSPLHKKTENRAKSCQIVPNRAKAAFCRGKPQSAKRGFVPHFAETSANTREISAKPKQKRETTNDTNHTNPCPIMS